MSSKKREMSESGMLVYPKLPVPKPGRESEPKLPRKSSSLPTAWLVLAAVALLGGAAAGFFARPHVLEDSRVTAAESALAKEKLAVAEAQATIAKLQADATKLDEQRELLDKQLAAAKQAQEMLADKSENAKKLADDLAATKTKLDATRAGTTMLAANAVHLTIPAATLFKSDAELSPAGMKALDRVAGALKVLGDKQIAIHGHTDDQPPPRPAPPKPAKPAKPAKGQKAKDKKPEAVAPPAPAEPAFATNWELSAARALTVVHYLQDEAKIDPTRLAAVAFGEYRPVSKVKAKNRRIEIVLYPRAKITK